ncbi:flavin reductase family protein [Sphingobium sp. B11D3D]|uniref:flavin reductase family protein n=1 Tax=Sphingobium sp. B11D3D TaxID=2940576 RepID=UPI0022254FCF|nr:flavin reductase family protein [Sphingobium sp. B11D3D]MCW2368289.1 flavin reductase (DIM6/NTAB) family NADH-FMN oxidoreductase RutF [Sphingobium sp. B11D3D]
MANVQPLFFDPKDSASFKRGIFNAIVAPRPIGWLSTVDEHGKSNLAPFSYFNIVSNLPPILMFSCNTPEDRPAKDTLANVRKTGEFVFNLVAASQLEAMNDTSSPVPYGVDEFEHFGIEKAPCRVVAAPRVAASPCSLECRVIKVVSFGGGDLGPETNVTFGEVVGMHIAPGYLHEDGHFDTLAARPVSRLGGAEYAVTQESFELTRKFKRANEATY